MVSLSQVFLRAIQFVFTLIITALVGNALDNIFTGTPASINYAMFAAAFSWIVLLYGLVAAFIESLAWPFVLIILDGLATLFTFVAAVVLAARLHVHSCTNVVYLATNNLINGSSSPRKTCRELQASCAFLWFLFAAFTVSLVVDFISSKGSFSTGRAGGVRKSGPAMTQV